MPSQQPYILKSTGEQQRFDPNKLNKQLLYTGLSSDLAKETIADLEKDFANIHSTGDIYNHVSTFLRKEGAIEHYYNYSLRRAVNLLGPTGHPFEQLVSEVLKTQDFHTEVGAVALGKCVTHEIDVVATRDDEQYFIECKFHNSTGTKTDIQVALYTYARFLDVKFAMEQTHGTEKKYFPWLITNTKVTSEVFDYGDCNNLKVTAWYYPEGEGLRDMIIRSGLHPVTLLYHLSQRKIDELINRNIVTLSSLKKAIKMHIVDDVLSAHDIEHVLKDIKCITTNECTD